MKNNSKSSFLILTVFVSLFITLNFLGCGDEGQYNHGTPKGGNDTEPTQQGKTTTEKRWVQLGDGKPSDKVETNVSSSTTDELAVDFNVPGINVVDIIEEGETFQSLDIIGGSVRSDVSKPQTPSLNRYFAAPINADVNVEVVHSEYDLIEGYTVFPFQEPPPDVEGIAPPPFTKDESLYSQDIFYPFDLVELEGPFIIRGMNVMMMRVNFIQFNPLKRQLKAYSSIHVKISFTGGQTVFTSQPAYSLSFENMFDNYLLNNDIAVPRMDRTSRQMTYQTEDDHRLLLIITHPDFLEAANELKTWKIKKGIHTLAVSTDETGDTAFAIQSYIQNAYDSWENPPSHILLIGDAEFIPCHYVTEHPRYNHEDWPQGYIGTDLYYATVDGDDYFPDISIGRLSIDTINEALKRVDDIIQYEKAPPENPSFYQNISICAEFQDVSEYDPKDGRAARRFAQTSEDLSIFFSNQYQIERVYKTNSEIIPLYWSLAHWSFGGGPAGDQGAMIPSYLQKPKFSWDGGYADISAAVNEGVFLLTHRDHGWHGGWSKPSYQTRHVQEIQNGDQLPVVWSINCMTGWFDNETDDAHTGTPADAIHFSEAWERNPHGGAVGIIAASRISQSGYNDHLVWGWTDAIWPDFIPANSSTTNTKDKPIYEMGHVLNHGKFYMASKYSVNNATVKNSFEMFHWFGDPTMEIWTEIPKEFIVSHDMNIYQGSSSIDVEVNESNALICVTKDDKILSRKFSENGMNNLMLSENLILGDQVNIVVSKSNFRPYENTITVGNEDSIRILIDSSKDGGVWWCCDNDNFNPDEPHQGKELADYLRSSGYEVVELPVPTTITYNLLSEFDLIIRANEDGDVTIQEIDAYHDYVKNGGKLLLASEYMIPNEIDELASSFGIIFRGISRGENKLTDFALHDITAGIDQINYSVGSGVIEYPDSASIIGNLSNETYLDYNNNEIRDNDEPVGMPALGEMEVGAGHIVFIGDTNTLLKMPQPFIDNLFEYLLY